MIFPIDYDMYIGAEHSKWLKERKVKYKVRWSNHNDNYVLIINNEEDAVAFKLMSGMKSSGTGFVFVDVK